MIHIDRRIEISEKLNLLGKSLIAEGSNKSDYSITQAGIILITLSETIIDDDGMYTISEFLSMFLASKIIEFEEHSDDETIKRFRKIFNYFIQSKNGPIQQ